MKLLKAMATVGGLTGVSRVFGFIRDIMTAAYLGAGPIADAFFVALKLPNFFRRVTAEGAFSVSFVPIYSAKLEQGQGDDRAANEFASQTLSIMLTILIPFSILVMFAMPWVIYVIAPGFESGELRYDLAVDLSRVTFPYLTLMSVVALFGGVLNTHDKFAPFASAPVLFNLAIIAALFFGTPIMQTPAHAMAWGVLAAGILQFIWLFYFVRRNGIRLSLPIPRLTGDTRHLLRLMGPGVIGAGVVHINLFADLIIASLLGAGSISYLYYADRLNQLPLGLVGIAVGTALLPMLSKAISGGNSEEGRHLFNRALEICLLLALPAAIALFFIPHVIIETLFERGAFDAQDTDITATVLMGYAIGLPAYVTSKVLSTAYWARQNTMHPVKISVITTFVNIALSLILIRFIGVAGIAVSTGLCGWLQFYLLRRGLHEYSDTKFDTRFLRNLPRIIFSACLMGFVLVLIAPFLMDVAGHILGLAALVLSGIAVYTLGVFITGAIAISDIKTYLFKGERLKK